MELAGHRKTPYTLKIAICSKVCILSQLTEKKYMQGCGWRIFRERIFFYLRKSVALFQNSKVRYGTSELYFTDLLVILEP